MRAPLVLLFVLVAPQLVGFASAAVQLEIGTTDYATHRFTGPTAPKNEDYFFGFLNPPFNGQESGNGSIQSFGLEIATDFGTLTKDDPARTQITIINVSNATTSIEIRYESRASRGLFGFFGLDQEVFINGSKVWQSSTFELHPWAGLHYQSSAILAYEVNASARPPNPQFPLVEEAGAPRTYPGGSLVYIDPNDGGDLFSGKHSLRRYYLANLSGVVSVLVSTTYLPHLPHTLELKYRFETADALAEREAGLDCGGAFKNWVRDTLGACPSIQGLLNVLAGGFTVVLRLILGSVFGEAGAKVADFLGLLVSQLMSAIVLLARLLFVDPARMFVVYEALVIGLGLMLGGYAGDAYLTLRFIRGGNLALLLLVVYWFVFLYNVFRFALTLFARIVQAIVQAVRG